MTNLTAQQSKAISSQIARLPVTDAQNKAMREALLAYDARKAAFAKAFNAA